MLLPPRSGGIHNCLRRQPELVQDHDPQDQVSAGNAWYTDDQFEKQYNRPGPRAVIENRWAIFENAIAGFMSGCNPVAATDPVRILDAGCGDGINLYGLSNIVQARGWNAEIFGADYNALRVDRASKLPFVAEVRASPLHSLPYPDGHFQVVLCNQVLEHIPEEKKVLVELKRILQPAGMLILGVPNEACLMARMRNHVLQRSILRTTDHVNFYTGTKLRDLLTETGYTVESIATTGFFTPHLVAHYALSYFAPGRRLLKALGRIFPSQCAELLAIARRT